MQVTQHKLLFTGFTLPVASNWLPVSYTGVGESPKYISVNDLGFKIFIRLLVSAQMLHKKNTHLLNDVAFNQCWIGT